MDINSIYSSTGVAFVESVPTEKNKSDSQEENSGAVSSWGADSVSISSEAREILAAVNSPESEGGAQNQSGTGSEAASGSAGGGGASSESDSKVESLKARLASLQASLGQSNGADATVINAQIAQVMAEIAAMETEAA